MKNRYGFGENAPGNNSVSNFTSATIKNIVKTIPFRVLRAEDFEFWQHNGFVIIRNAVCREDVTATAALLWEFQEMDPYDSSSWYRPQLRQNSMEELNNSGMVECYNNQLLWNNRQNTEKLKKGDLVGDCIGSPEAQTACAEILSHLGGGILPIVYFPNPEWPENVTADISECFFLTKQT